MNAHTPPAELWRAESRVAAVVVTYNRLGKLPRTLEAVYAQDHRPEWVVVVNNNSSDGTREFLDGLSPDEYPGLVVMHLNENLGGAGGFEVGMERGYQLGSDYVWIMDDDCYPDSDALSILLEQRFAASEKLGRPVPFACSLVRFIDGSLCEMNNPITTWDWPRAYLLGLDSLLIVECTFVSVLVPRFALEEQGLPLRDYFIWFDDKEYTKRLTRAFGPGIIALKSEVVHDMGVNAGVNYRQVTKENLWKFEKGARNQASYRFHFEGKFSYISYIRRVLVEMRQGGVEKPVKRRMRQALWSGRKFNPQPRFPSPSSD
ncbi:glycosyltransferase family 2 protein [Leucobacter chromiireducens]|uniref:Glycosyltransferase n=1 Tax=Leucobacter chromiireducens subsp. chromiireducens TaxID=660067 RepID=A0ABS1SPP1_9MICO|nr:glycosyltransferase family 2 protein [Leucobacter chromiireducens]MBL3690136.1 glycosyltransferase [Leucobacter chromiireducens subsp. chromiireducens]